MLQLMLVHKRSGVVSTQPLTAVTITLVGLLVTIILALALVSLWRGLLPPSTAMADAELARELAASRDQVRELEMEREVVAQRLAEAEARLFRIEAVGQQLSDQLGLTPPEPGTVPGQGGPAEADIEPSPHALPERPTGVPSASTSAAPRESVDDVDDLTTALDLLDRAIAEHQSGFEVLERVLAFQQEHASVQPAGRPLAEGWLSSPFGRRRDPFTGKPAFHRGVDFSGPRNSRILSLGAGVVTFVGTRSGYGKTVEIQHGAGLKTRYAHNADLLVARGDVVERGQPIALLGRTGRATAAHVHLEVIRDGKYIDPMPFVRASTAAVN